MYVQCMKKRRLGGSFVECVGLHGAGKLQRARILFF